MVRYLNCEIDGTTETIDQLDLSDFNNYSEFRKELSRLKGEYAMGGYYSNLRWSQRACKDWK